MSGPKGMIGPGVLGCPGMATGEKAGEGLVAEGATPTAFGTWPGRAGR